MRLETSGPDLPRGDRQNVLRQVGWLSRDNEVYDLSDPDLTTVLDGLRPLFIVTGVWEDLGDEKWGIKD